MLDACQVKLWRLRSSSCETFERDVSCLCHSESSSLTIVIVVVFTNCSGSHLSCAAEPRQESHSRSAGSTKVGQPCTEWMLADLDECSRSWSASSSCCSRNSWSMYTNRKPCALSPAAAGNRHSAVTASKWLAARWLLTWPIKRRQWNINRWHERFKTHERRSYVGRVLNRSQTTDCCACVRS